MAINLQKPLLNITILWTVFFSFISPDLLRAQFVNTGTDRASVNWNTIETLHYIVIYPKNYESKAIDYAMKLEHSYKNVIHSIGFEPKKTRYILRTHSAMSNGMTAVAPNRVELWTKPHQDIYGQSWDEQLILHEGRHVAQFGSMYRGASRLPIWLTGQMGYSFPIGLYIPDWFMEGDAVVTETALSEFGRGRLPGFEKGMRTYFLQQGNPGYDKMMLGSYRDHIPNHYETGYQVVAANRVFRDSNIFKDKLEDIARYPWYFWPFSNQSNGLKDTRNFKYYAFAADTLMILWREQDRKVHAKQPKVIYTSDDYTGLTYLKSDNGRLFANISTMDRLPRIVEIEKNGSLKNIVNLGYSNGKYFDVHEDLLAFTLETPDIRWEQESNMSLFVMDLKSGAYNMLSHNNNYYSPAIHPDNDKIAAVEMNDQNQCSIVILDVSDGTVLQRVQEGNNDYIITPQWTSDGTALIYIKITAEGKVLCLNDFKTERVLFGPSKLDFKHPEVHGYNVYVSGDWSGIENIYRISIWGGEPVKVTNSRFGAISPVILNDTLTYLDYSWKGNNIVQLSRDQITEVLFLDVQNHAPNLYLQLADMENGEVDFSNMDTVAYKISRYRKFPEQFNFHSWIPGGGYTLTGNAYVPGVSILSQSLLNDATLVLGYNFLANNTQDKFYLNYIYQGLFPVIHINGGFNYYRDQTLDYRYYSNPYSDYGGYGYSNIDYGGYVSLDDYFADRIVNKLYMQYRLDSKIEVPLSKRVFDYTMGLIPYIYGGFKTTCSLSKYRTEEEYGREDFTTYYGFGFSHYLLKQLAYKDIYPRYGYYLNTIRSFYNYTGKYSNYYFNSYGAQVRIYLPGLMRHHSLIINSSYLKKHDPYNYTAFANSVAMPVGWHSVTNSRYGNTNIRFGGEYYFPVGYPDAEIFWLAYIKRLNLGIWADYGTFEYDIYNSLDKVWDEYNIVGGSAWADINLFRYPIEFKIGAKFGYSFSHESKYVNLILNVGSLF